MPLTINHSDASGSLTDLSLKSKSQTASMSMGASMDSSLGMNSGNESGKYNDDGSPSDNSNGESGKGSISESLKDSMSPSPPESRSTGYRPVEKLSMANMKKHDRELALMQPPRRVYGLNNLGTGFPQSLATADSLEKKKMLKTKKAKLMLPRITSSLDRSFPLPNPHQIEIYFHKDEKVGLETRPSSAQNSSSPDTMNPESIGSNSSG